MELFKTQSGTEMVKAQYRVVFLSGGYTSKGLRVINIGGKDNGDYRGRALDITLMEDRAAFGPVMEWLQSQKQEAVIGGRVAIKCRRGADPHKVWITFPDQIAFKPVGAKKWKLFERVVAEENLTQYITPSEKDDIPF